MTNPISKAIVKAAVAMGYGKKSDYKGSSVAEVLEKFASIAKDKGGSGGGGEPFEVVFSYEDNETLVCNRTQQEIVQAYNAGKNVKAFAILNGDQKVELLASYGLDLESGDAFIFRACFFNVTSFDVSQATYVFGKNGIDVLVHEQVFTHNN